MSEQTSREIENLNDNISSLLKAIEDQDTRIEAIGLKLKEIIELDSYFSRRPNDVSKKVKALGDLVLMIGRALNKNEDS